MSSSRFRLAPFSRFSRRAWLAAAACGLALPATAAAQSVRRPWPARRPTPRLDDLPLLSGALAARDGQALLVNFWATWCGPCREEMHALETAAARHAAAGLRVLAVNFREPEAAVRRFLDETALQLPVARDADGTCARAFDVHVFPSTVAIGRDGRARFTIVGEHDWTDDQAQGWIAEILR